LKVIIEEKVYMFNMLIHCKSLGNTPHIGNIHNSWAVEQSVTPIEHIWAWTAECSKRNGGISNLLIACHGGYEIEKKEFGGWGILLGTGLNQVNATLTEKLAGRVKNIYLYVCGGAQESDLTKLGKDKDPALQYANNRLTCKMMAKHSKCNIYAATDIQGFNKSDWWYKGFTFGKWEGKVEKFTAAGDILEVTSRMQEFGKETGNE
jgi:hypothetical protein